MTTLTLVRHGQASFGRSNYDQLSDLGHRQGLILGQHWKTLGTRFDAIHSGQLARQQDTARRLLEGLQAQPQFGTHAGFDEYDFMGILRGYLPVVAAEAPELQVLSSELFQDPRRFQAVFERCIACWLDGRAPVGRTLETWAAFCERVRAALRDVATPDREHVVAVTSGGVIAVALREAMGLSDAMTFQMNWRIFNASVHRFRVGKRGLSLMGYNDIAHLELAADPQLLTFR